MKTSTLGLFAAMACCAVSAQAASFDGWTLNGNAQTIGSGATLRLTDNYGQAGSAWAPDKVSLAADFSIAFSFRLSGGDAADGITLTLHNNDAGTSTIGFGGGYLGYQGIDKSVAFVYDTYENGFDTDRTPGPNTSVAVVGDLVNTWGGSTVGQAYDLRDKVVYSWIDYIAAGSGEFRMYISDTNVKPGTVQHNLLAPNWVSIFGSEELHVGFTAGTGSQYDKQDILSFSVTTVPEPQTWALGLVGTVLTIAFARRRG